MTKLKERNNSVCNKEKVCEEGQEEEMEGKQQVTWVNSYHHLQQVVA